ncbi:M17 family peptidase N-terminal domain-containing protein, partial [Mycobacterium palustre]|uniref:M17 family peptidase N-terminal domain-containing protein n=1 Tax=Mycobacterium palustre TaxID=153971 RepID=UPI0027E251F6
MTTEPGYQSPIVNVATSLPKRGAGGAVLLVPVVSTGDDDRPGAAVAAAEPFLPAEAVGEIEAALRALEATGGSEQVHRLVVPSLPVASVLTIGLGKPRSEWPADTVRRAAGVAARSLGRHRASGGRRGGAVAGRRRGGDH